MTFFRTATQCFIGLLIAFSITLWLGGFLVNRYFSWTSAQEFVVAETMVDIPFGSSLKRVSEILGHAEVIGSPKQFFWYLRLGRKDGAKIQAGYYQFADQQSFRAVGDRLLFGTDQSFRVTFKEGQTLTDLVDSLVDVGLVNGEQFVEAMKSEEIISLINPPGVARDKLKNGTGGVEGYLFPDTYFFSKKDSAHNIIKKMYLQLMMKIDQSIWDRIDERRTNLHDVLTLASIIEKETGAASERPIISSVYHNRLRLGMMLQADPTVIYGIKDYAGKIGRADLRAYHPYNTYTIKGLPPGPISSVGIESIRAALWPADTKYLYFVSKNDGSHIFCENLSCHNAAVRKWQIEYFRKAERK